MRTQVLSAMVAVWLAVLAAPMPDNAAAGYKLVASSQYQDYGPALAEDGNGESRWVSNGDKPGMGPTPEKPEYLQFDFDALSTRYPRSRAARQLSLSSRRCGPQGPTTQH